MRAGWDSALSLRRRLIAFVEGEGRPVSVAEAVAAFQSLGKGHVTALDVTRSTRGARGALSLDADGRLQVDPAHPALPAIRRLARARAARSEAERRSRVEQSKRTEQWRQREANEREERRRWYAAAEKAVLRAVFEDDRMAMAVVLDPDRRVFEEFRDAEAARIRLARAEVVLGLDPWPDLRHLGVETAGRTLVDLSPPNKTLRLNQRGRTLRIRPDLLIGSTLGHSRPLGDPKALRGYVQGGEHGRLRRRLEADLKSLWRFYEYGCLHRFVRLRWGFLDEGLWVNWNVGRLPTLGELLDEETGTRWTWRRSRRHGGFRARDFCSPSAPAFLRPEQPTRFRERVQGNDLDPLIQAIAPVPGIDDRDGRQAEVLERDPDRRSHRGRVCALALHPEQSIAAAKHEIDFRTMVRRQEPRNVELLGGKDLLGDEPFPGGSEFGVRKQFILAADPEQVRARAGADGSREHR